MKMHFYYIGLAILGLSSFPIKTSDKKIPLNKIHDQTIKSYTPLLLNKTFTIKETNSKNVTHKTDLSDDLINVVQEWHNRCNDYFFKGSCVPASITTGSSGLCLLYWFLSDESLRKIVKYNVVLNSSIEAAFNIITLGCCFKNRLNKKNHQQNINNLIASLIKNNYSENSVLNSSQKTELRLKILEKVKEEYKKPSPQEFALKLITFLNFSTTTILSAPLAFNFKEGTMNLFEAINFFSSFIGIGFSLSDLIALRTLDEYKINILDKHIKELLDKYCGDTV